MLEGHHGNSRAQRSFAQRHKGCKALKEKRLGRAGGQVSGAFKINSPNGARHLIQHCSSLCALCPLASWRETPASCSQAGPSAAAKSADGYAAAKCPGTIHSAVFIAEMLIVAVVNAAKPAVAGLCFGNGDDDACNKAQQEEAGGKDEAKVASVCHRSLSFQYMG